MRVIQCHARVQCHSPYKDRLKPYSTLVNFQPFFLRFVVVATLRVKHSKVPAFQNSTVGCAKDVPVVQRELTTVICLMSGSLYMYVTII